MKFIYCDKILDLQVVNKKNDSFIHQLSRNMTADCLSIFVSMFCLGSAIQIP